MVHVGRKFDSWYLGEESRSTSLIETDAGDVEVTFVTSQAVRSVQTKSGIEISEQTFEALSRATKRRDSKKKGGLKNLSQRKKEAVEAYCRMQTAAGEWLKTSWPSCDEEMPTHFRGGGQIKYHVVALMYKYLSDKDTGICLKPAAALQSTNLDSRSRGVEMDLATSCGFRWWTGRYRSEGLDTMDKWLYRSHERKGKIAQTGTGIGVGPFGASAAYVHTY